MLFVIDEATEAKVPARLDPSAVWRLEAIDIWDAPQSELHLLLDPAMEQFQSSVQKLDDK